MDYDESEVLSQLMAFVEEAGTQVNAAKKLGISLSYLNDLLQGHRHISAEIAGKLGFEKRTVFTQKE